jgi:hypothetical protein
MTMSDATAAMLPVITLIASGSAYLALIVLAVVCVLATSIVHNRLDEMRFVEQALATFVMKSESNILSKTSLGTVDVSNPYGIAFVATIADLFMDKFYSWLEPLLATGKRFALVSFEAAGTEFRKMQQCRATSLPIHAHRP